MSKRVDARTLSVIGLSTVLWASSFAGIKAGLVSYSPGHLVLFRFLMASIVLAIYAAITHMRLPARCDLPMIALTGFITITFYQILLNYGEQTVSAGASSFIVAIVPVFTALMATAFLGERLNRIGWLGVAISFIGVGLISAGQGSGLSFTPGALLVLVAALAEAIGFVLQKPLLKRYTGLELAAYILWSATLFMLVFAPGLPQAITSAPIGATLAIVYLAIFPAAIANVGWSYALSKASASQVTSALNVMPIVSVAIAWLWLGEQPTPVVIVGGAIALAGVILLNTRGKLPETPEIAPGLEVI